MCLKCSIHGAGSTVPVASYIREAWNIIASEIHKNNRLRTGSDIPSASDMAEKWRKSLIKGISITIGGGDPESVFFDVQKRMEANVSRFATYKAFNTSNLIKSIDGSINIPLEKKEAAKRLISDVAKQRQDAEYNTAVARARTAKQFLEYNTASRTALYQNLRWIPSRSAVIREEHAAFYNRVWSKDDPFWDTNFPGNMWNCKCDVEETSERVTGDNDAIGAVPPQKGLETNPSTGVIFSPEASYFRLSDAVKNAAMTFYQRSEKKRLLSEFSPVETVNAISINDTKTAFTRLLKHVYSEDGFAVASVVRYRLAEFKNPVREALGERKDKNNPKDAANIAKKKSRGVKGYITYEFQYMGKTWIVGMEEMKGDIKQFYYISPKKKRMP